MINLTIKYPWGIALQLKASGDKRAELKRIGKGDSKGGQFAPKGTSGIDSQLAGIVVTSRKASAARVRAYKVRKRLEKDPKNEALMNKLKVANAEYKELKNKVDVMKKNLPPDKNILASGKVVEAKRHALTPESLNSKLSSGNKAIDGTHIIKQTSRPEGRDLGKYTVTDKNGDVVVRIEYTLTDHIGEPLKPPGFVVEFNSLKSYQMENLADAVSMASGIVKSESQAIERWRNLPEIQRKPVMDSLSLRTLEKEASKYSKMVDKGDSGYESVRNKDILDHINSVIKQRKAGGDKSVAIVNLKGTSERDLRTPNVDGLGNTGFNNKAEREAIGKVNGNTAELREGVTEAQAIRYKRRAMAVEAAANKRYADGTSVKDEVDNLLKEGFILPEGKIDARTSTRLKSRELGGGWRYSPKGKEAADYLQVALDRGKFKRNYKLPMITTVAQNVKSLRTPTITAKGKTLQAFDNETERGIVYKPSVGASSTPNDGITRDQAKRYSDRMNAVNTAKRTVARDGTLISTHVENEVKNGYTTPVGRITEKQAKLKRDSDNSTVVMKGKIAIDYLKVLLNTGDKERNY